MNWIYWLLGGGTLYIATIVSEDNTSAVAPLALASILWFITAILTRQNNA